MKSIFLAAAAVAALSLGGCGHTGLALASAGATLAGAAQGPIPGQATTLADALRLATVATDLTKAAVDTGRLTQSQLLKVNAANDGLHAALVDLEAENAQGHALSFASFNAALAAWNAYTASLPKP